MRKNFHMSTDIRGKVAIVGVGHTAQGELAGQSPELNAVLAIKEALRDAGIDRAGLDGLISCKSVQGTSTDIDVGPLLGLDPRYAQALDYGTCNFSLHLAVQAIVTGMADTIALCYGANARTNRFPFGAAPATLAGASGLMHIAGPAALALRRHMAIYGTTEEQFGRIAVSGREWARRNPLALFRDPLTIEQYLASEYLVEPLRRADVTMLSDGGVALIVTRAERAKDFPNKPVYVLGMSEQSQIRGEFSPDYLERRFIKGAAEQIWSNTGLRPADIDLLYIQDPTAVWILQMIEYYGFAPLGEAGRWLAEGHTFPGGSLPLNTNGGQLNESYMWGWLHMVEAVRQLRGQAGSERQVKDAELALYCSTQAFQKAGASILSTHEK
jgi:acetyl-CoA acetyltransferase